MAVITEITEFAFSPEALRVDERRDGLSMFMRVRDGADFVERAIRSHLPFVDEIAVTFNDCRDATPDILARLQDDVGPERLRLAHYRPDVHPMGSDGHRAEDPASPRSMVAYSNAALCQTSRTLVAKLDDDHVAIEPAFAAVVAALRQDGLLQSEMACFSGINLAQDAAGTIGVLAREPFAGSGDHGFQRVSAETRFTHSPKHEIWRRDHLTRVFHGFGYWHLKYLKQGFGFANYGIERGENDRVARKKAAFLADRRVIPIAALAAKTPVWAAVVAAFPPEIADKFVLKAARWRALAERAVTDADLSAFVTALEAGQAEA